MAVQQRRKTRSTRGMRRSHDSLVASTISVDSETGEKHLRHHMTADGFYRGRQVIRDKEELLDEAEASDELKNDKV